MSEIAANWKYVPFLIGGLEVTIKVTVMALFLAVPVAFILALGRMSHFALLRWGAGLVVELFRGTSALVQLFWAYYVLPYFGINLTPFVAGVVVLGLNEASYFAEMVRPALQSVLSGQRDACISLHLPGTYRFFHITLPQSLPLLLPPFANTVVAMLKFSALVSLVTLQDLSYRAGMIRSATGSSEIVFGSVLLIYFAMSLIIVGIIRQMEIRASRKLGRAFVSESQSTRTSVPKWALGR